MRVERRKGTWGDGACGVGIFGVRSTGSEAGVRWVGGVTCERSGIGSDVVGMLSCSGHGEGGAGGDGQSVEGSSQSGHVADEPSTMECTVAVRLA